MKHVKHYESIINEEPQMGYYVLMRSSLHLDKYTEETVNFINNTIGQIINDYTNERNIEKNVYVKYENVPIKLKKTFQNNARMYKYSQIVYCSKNKEDIEAIFASNKYNL